MDEFVSFVLGAIGLYIAVRITMIPMQILAELKRQGQLREEADKRMIGLLIVIAQKQNELHPDEDLAAKRQAALDIKTMIDKP